MNRQRTLPKVAGRSRHFPLLIERAGINFYLGSDSALVVVERFEIDLHPAVFLCAMIFQEQRSAVTLRDDQIHAARSSDIGGCDSEGLIEFHRVQLRVFRRVRPVTCAQIPEQPYLAAVCAFANRDEIDPTIVVEVDRRNSCATLPVEIRQRDAFEAFAFVVAPQTDSRRSGMRERQIHPAIFVEIERDHSNRWRQSLFRKVNSVERPEFAFAGIQQNRRTPRAACQHKINRAIVIEIGSNHTGSSCFFAQRSFGGNIGKGAVAIVAPHDVVRPSARFRADVEIEIPVMIEIDERDDGAALFAADVHSFRHVSKFAAAVVVKQVNAIAHANDEIRFAIIVVIARGAAQSAASDRQSRADGFVLKFSVAPIVQKTRRAVFCGAYQQQVRLAITVVVEEARSRARSSRDGLRSVGHRNRRGSL